jgi:hypothetical protein
MCAIVLLHIEETPRLLSDKMGLDRHRFARANFNDH